MAAISVFLLVLRLFLLVSSNPDLSEKVTRDAHFRCDMTGFHGRMHSLLALQIVKKAGQGQGQDVALASVDSTKAWVWDQLQRPEQQKHYVSGQINLSQRMDAFLKLTIANFSREEEGVYSCQIVYEDHPADIKPSTWITELTVSNTSLSNEIKTPGFLVWFSQGVHITCDYSGTTDGDENVARMVISAGELSWRAQWSGEDDNATCSPELLGPYHRRKRSEAGDRLEVHIPDVTCQHQSQHVCYVTTSSGKTLSSSKRRLPLECPQGLKADQPTTTMAYGGVQRYTASSTTMDRGVSNVVYYVAPVGVIVFLLACVGLFCFMRRRRKHKEDRSLNGHKWRCFNYCSTCTVKKSPKPKSLEDMENAANGFLVENSVFKQTVRKNSKKEISEATENAGSLYLAGTSLSERSDKPLLSENKKKENDGPLKADETWGMERPLLVMLCEADPQSPKDCLAHSDETIDSFPGETALEQLRGRQCKFDYVDRMDSSDSTSSTECPSRYVHVCDKVLQTPVQASEHTGPSKCVM